MVHGHSSKSRPTVADLVAPSAAFLSRLPPALTTTKAQPLSQNGLVRAEIDALLKRKRYDTLLSLLATWTAPSQSINWQNTLKHRELSYILQQIVTYQIGVLQESSTSKSVSNNVHTSTKFSHARAIREGLRKVYSNLLGGNSNEHLYIKGRKYTGSFRLNSCDFENLVSLELNNGKLDLASKWFQAMEHQYPNKSHYSLMTYNLWLLKFQVYGGSSPALWQVQPTVLYEKKVNPRRGNLKSEMTWTEIFNDFIKNQAASSGSDQAIFDTKLVCQILYSVAYKGNLPQLYKLIESNWGIGADGKMSKNFVPLEPSNPLYPNTEVLQAVVISMLYNKRYVASLTYINSFQAHYALDLGSKNAKRFWDSLFRWSEITTRYSEYRALHQYIKETNVKALLGPSSADELRVTLEEAKNLAEFDYEGYLRYIADLRAQRSGLIKELWRCYQESAINFSVRPYQTLLTLAGESRSEPDCYELLRHLFEQNDIYSVSADSYNAGMTAGKTGLINELYINTMKVLIDITGESGRMGLIPYIIHEWSLNAAMAVSLEKWASMQETRYLEALNAQSGEPDEDEDVFLGLL